MARAPCISGCWGYRLQLVRNQQQNEDTLFLFGTVFTYKSIEKATKNFSNLLGRGGFTDCYKGSLENGTVVAVKVLRESCSAEQYREYFSSVMRTMSRISHRNVVEFIGYCLEDNHRIHVYEFVGDYDLNKLLFRREGEIRPELSWPIRASICLGVARGIQYLHCGLSPSIVHRAIKASNVLLDKNFSPKITAFKLAHAIEDTFSGYSDSVVGTYGYLAPEYFAIGGLPEKIDVYSFGVLLLEIITGRTYSANIVESDCNLIHWVWGLRESGCVMETVDPRLSEGPEEEELVRFINTALFCVQPSSNHRPTMFEVLLMLSGGYDFSMKLVPNPMTIPAIHYDLMDRPAPVNRRGGSSADEQPEAALANI